MIAFFSPLGRKLFEVFDDGKLRLWNDFSSDS